MKIPFNKPHLTGKEAHYMYQAVYNGKLSGNGEFTKRCQHFFEERYGFKKCLLTTSCTDALEMAAILCDIQPGDEVIVPSYTFVSSALAFVRQGAKIVFADSMERNPNMDADKIESLITPRTKVIVPVHYAGVACDMDKIMDIANRHNLLVVEDAAQAIDSYYGLTPCPPLLKARGDVKSADVMNYSLLEGNAKTMRSEPTDAEMVLWEQIRNNQLGQKFRRQHVIGNYIADFVCLAKQLIVEVDGEYHLSKEQQASDTERDAWLREQGYQVIHFTNEQVLYQTEYVLHTIKEALLPSPSPRLQERGSRGEARPLGGIGHLAAFSFHETKNIIAGEGGMLVINDERFIRRAEIIWEKGTNRAEFFRGEVNKYGWVDTGSSFLPSEVIAAFLWAQLECLDEIQTRRKKLWNLYYDTLSSSSRFQSPLAFRRGDGGEASPSPAGEGLGVRLPDLPSYATNNAHMFYLVSRSLNERTELIKRLKENDILAVFHYLSLHSSPYYKDKHDGRELPQCDRYADCLVRLPLYYDLKEEDVDRISALVLEI